MDRAWVFGLVALGVTYSAHAFEVKPLVHDLAPVGRHATSTLIVANPSDQPLPIEITVNQRIFDDNGSQVLAPAGDDFFVFPPFASIAPGGTQSFRIQWLGKPELSESQSFYANVAQVPVTSPSASSAQLQYVLAFNVAVHVSPQGSAAKVEVTQTALEQDPDGQTYVVAHLQNTGTKYTYASRLALDLSSAKKRQTVSAGEILALELDTLLPPGVTKTLRIPVDNGDWATPVAVELRPIDRR